VRRLAGRRTSRSEEGAFIVEGAVLVAEAVDAGWRVTEQFVAPGAEPVVGAGPVRHLAPGVMDRIATTETPQPVLAVVERSFAGSEVLDTAGFVVVADGIADPGNLGTMLRSAEAAGADCVALTSGTVDPSNPKVVRSSAGAVFRVPVVEDVDLDRLSRAGIVRLGTSSHRGASHTDTDLRRRVAIVLGNEAHGLSDEADVDEWITIAHAGRSESLNVAMACTVLCFEVARQRRSAS
jgi:TrmH family RNA methyltransferase